MNEEQAEQLEGGAPEPANRLIVERRVGRFRIHRDLLYRGDEKALLEFMGNFLIVRAEMLFACGSVEYTAYSALFHETAPEFEPPLYHVLVGEDRSIQIEQAMFYPADAVKLPVIRVAGDNVVHEMRWE